MFGQACCSSTSYCNSTENDVHFFVKSIFYDDHLMRTDVLLLHALVLPVFPTVIVKHLIM